MSDKIKLGIMQPYFLPYIGYFQLLNAVDMYVVYDDVNFIKGGWINRNNILVNGKRTFINLLLNDASSNKRINEITIKHDGIHEKKLLKTIEMNYGKAPFFNNSYPVIESIINNSENNLGMYLFDQLKKICAYLEIKTDLVLSSNIHKNISLKGEDKVLDICKALNADTYYNSVGGIELYSKERFKKSGLSLCFLKTMEDLKYKQYNNDFVPNLSVLDVLMFNSVEQIQELLEQYMIL